MRIRHHQKRVGRSGSGKTYSMVVDLLKMADREDTGLAALLPHPEAADLLLLHLEAAGHIDRVEVDDLQDGGSRMLMKNYLRVSASLDGFVRARENEEYRDAFLSIPARRRDMEKLANTPAIEEYSDLACRVYQGLDEWMPLYLLPFLLVRGHALHEWAKAHCRDAEALAELEAVSDMNTHDWVALVLPAIRFLRGFLRRSHIRARTSRPATFDVAAHLKDCGDGRPGIYISRGGGSKEAIQVNMVSDFMQIAFDAKANPSDVRRVVFRDEGFNYGLVHAFEVEALNTLRGFKVSTVDAVQQYHPDPAIEVPFRQNTDSLIFQLTNWDMAMKGAQDLALALDRNKIHHTDYTTKQLHKGFRTEERKSVTRRTGMEGSSETVGLKDVPVYDTETEARHSYEPPDHQFVWKAQDIMRQGVGRCQVQLGNEAPREVQIDTLPELCAFPEDVPEEVRRILEEIKSRPIYQEPKQWPMPEPVKKEKKPRPEPKTQPKVSRGRRGGRS